MKIRKAERAIWQSTLKKRGQRLIRIPNRLTVKVYRALLDLAENGRDEFLLSTDREAIARDAISVYRSTMEDEPDDRVLGILGFTHLAIPDSDDTEIWLRMKFL